MKILRWTALDIPGIIVIFATHNIFHHIAIPSSLIEESLNQNRKKFIQYSDIHDRKGKLSIFSHIFDRFTPYKLQAC